MYTMWLTAGQIAGVQEMVPIITLSFPRGTLYLQKALVISWPDPRAPFTATQEQAQGAQGPLVLPQGRLSAPWTEPRAIASGVWEGLLCIPAPESAAFSVNMLSTSGIECWP